MNASTKYCCEGNITFHVFNFEYLLSHPASMSDQSKSNMWEGCDLERQVPYLVCPLLWVRLVEAPHMEREPAQSEQDSWRSPKKWGLSSFLDPQKSTCNCVPFSHGELLLAALLVSPPPSKPSICYSFAYSWGISVLAELCLPMLRLLLAVPHAAWKLITYLAVSLREGGPWTTSRVPVFPTASELPMIAVFCTTVARRQDTSPVGLPATIPSSLAVCVLFDFPCVTTWLGALTTTMRALRNHPTFLQSSG